MANSAGLDKTAYYKSSHLDLHYLQKYLFLSTGQTGSSRFCTFFCHSLSICLFNPISLLLQKLSFPLRDITEEIIISCSRLKIFEKKSENDENKNLETDYLQD